LRGRSIAPSSGLLLAADQPEHVVFPAPLGPTSPTFSPELIWNDRIDEQDLPAVLLGHRAERDHDAAL